jgi:hypothetical protein
MELVLKLFTTLIKRRCVYWLMWQSCLHWKNQLGDELGAEDIEDLTLGFPKGRIEFGDIPAGSTTSYREAPGGVYGYAAYRFKIHGRLVTQPGGRTSKSDSLPRGRARTR